MASTRMSEYNFLLFICLKANCQCVFVVLFSYILYLITTTIFFLNEFSLYVWIWVAHMCIFCCIFSSSLSISTINFLFLFVDFHRVSVSGLYTSFSSLIYLYPRHLSVLPPYVISLWVSLHVWIEATCICQYITTNPLYTLWFLLRCFAWGLR